MPAGFLNTCCGELALQANEGVANGGVVDVENVDRRVRIGDTSKNTYNAEISSSSFMCDFAACSCNILQATNFQPDFEPASNNLVNRSSQV
jgi:hypothetical protein